MSLVTLTSLPILKNAETGEMIAEGGIKLEGLPIEELEIDPKIKEQAKKEFAIAVDRFQEAVDRVIELLVVQQMDNPPLMTSYLIHIDTDLSNEKLHQFLALVSSEK